MASWHRGVRVGGFGAARLAIVVLAAVAGVASATVPVARAASFGYAQSLGSGGPTPDHGNGIAVDSSGNAYLAGEFGPDALAARLDVNGGVAWNRSFSGTGAVHGKGVAVDGSGNAYLTGDFSASATFDGTTLTSSGGSVDAFAVKLDPTGGIVWAKSFGGGDEDKGMGIAVDGGGNSYVVGYFIGTVNFGATTLTAPGSGNPNAFVTRLDADGNVVWATSLGGGVAGAAQGLAIAVDASGSSYLTGIFAGSASFGTTTLTGAGGADIFAAKLDPNGRLVWARGFGSSDDDNGLAIDVDGNGNVYLTGRFNGTVSFGATALTSAGGLGDGFVARLDPSGSVVWARGFGGGGADQSLGVALDGSGNVYLGGMFSGPAAFGSTILTGAGNLDAFAAKLDANGTLVWANHVGGAGGDVAQGIGVDGHGNVYLVGTYGDTADFDPGPGTFNLTSTGSSDVFAVKLVQASPPVNTLPGPQAAEEDTTLIFSTANGNRITVADADNGSTPLKITLAVNSGTLSLSTTAGLTFAQGDGTADPSMTFTGTLTAINAALDELTFTPAPNTNGSVSLQITTLDQLGPTGGQFDADTLAMTVNAVDDPPVAVADSYTLVAQSVLTVGAPGLLANDGDVDSPSLTTQLVSRTRHGTVSLYPDGSFTYTPTAGFAGTDVFTYSATDGVASSSPTTVTIAVTPTACVPRPRVVTRALADGRQLEVTIQATPTGNGGINPVSELRFGRLQNARVSFNGQPIASGQTLTSPVGSGGMLSFVVQRVTPGQPTTVPFTVVDACGEFPTLVGGGTAAPF